MGVCYRDGKGTRQNYLDSISWFQAAADTGHVIAMYNLACAYEENPNYQGLALYWHEQAAHSGYARAAFNAASLSNQKCDTRKMEKYLLRGVECGDPDCLYLVKKYNFPTANKLKIRKRPHVFLGYSAMRSPYWRNWIQSHLIPFLQEKGFSYYDYLSHSEFKNKISSDNIINIITYELSKSDLYISFYDIPTDVGPKTLPSIIPTLPSFDDFEKYNELDFYAFEKQFTYRYFRSPYTQLHIKLLPKDHNNKMLHIGNVAKSNEHATCIDHLEEDSSESLLSNLEKFFLEIFEF